MLRIKKNDTVYVIAGRDKGKTGKVLTVLPEQNRVIVEGVNVVKKSMRKRSEEQPGGIITLEAPMHLSNLMLFCRSCNKPSRIKIKTLNDKSRARVCSSCNEVI
jgi:large subunit ribosomal protein L24